MKSLLTGIFVLSALAVVTITSAEEKPHAVIVVGTHHYTPNKTMPLFAAELERLGFRTTVINPDWDPEKDKRGLPGLEALADADVGIFFTRFLKLEDGQLSHITNYLESGKPVVGFRTSTHAFNYPDDHPGHDWNDAFGRDALGTPYLIHLAGGTKIEPAKGAGKHPIMTGVETDTWDSPGTLYLTNLEPGTTPLLMGTGNPKGGKAQVRTNQFGTHDLKPVMTDTVAWTWENKWGGRTFSTSLGHVGDFAVPQSMRVMVNGVFWAAGKPVPTVETEIRTLNLQSKTKPGPKPEIQVSAADSDAGKDSILFYGNSMVERLLEHGEMEARLQIAHPDTGLKIRSLAWTGDEVGNRLRVEGYAQHMKNLIAEWPANTIVLGYGLNESFSGKEGLADFEKHYRQHLKQLSLTHPNARFIFLSPIAIEGGTDDQNESVALYRDVIAKLAKERDADFIDLFSTTQKAYSESESRLTEQGIHLNDAGNQIIAGAIAEALGGTSEPDPTHLREVTLAATAKHMRVAEVVRPKNAVVYFGVRKRPEEYADEMPRYHEMIRLTEAVLHDLAKDPKASFAGIEAPSLEPMPEGKGRDDGDRTGIIKSVAEQQAEFTVADGYKVNLFASEEEFPELRNPVQIAFDARGRLWVVTMPSFPHTVPGLTPPDKVLILEDTDRDGRADKVTTYMEGLDALDGVAFHRDGVIISEQPRLWMTHDSNGDDRTESKEELLRGIDVTDSHHGGMIATDPLGNVIFSDGVFHRSQLETPFGVHRGIDATTYRLDPITGKINTEWQHTTPNPWNVTFDRWGNIFQMYGDGGSHDGAALIWTPLGAYHPYNYAEIGKYGKGSGFAAISSPNFPEEYQEGIASASLLGRYAVNLTKFDYSEGLIKHEGPLTILSSPNAAFRPADVEFGMDGALYVSDFCSPIIGHAQHPMRDPHWDHDYGRIWRIVHTEKPLVTNWPEIEGADAGALCKLLTHPQDLVRRHARIELRRKGGEGIKALNQWIGEFDRSDESFDQAALEAIFVLGGLKEVRPDLIDELLKSESPMFRGAAVDAIRLLADQLDGVKEILTAMAADPHPRVQLKVIGAVGHLQQTDPSMRDVLAAITSEKTSIQQSLKTLELGTEPKRGRSVPVLEVDPASELTHWIRYDPGGAEAPVIHTSGNPSGGALHIFRTFVTSESAQPAVLALNHKCLDVRVNDILKFSQNSNWSSDQQIYIDLQEGQNVIEIELKKPNLGRGSGSLPAVYLYNSVGRALTGVQYLADSDKLKSFDVAHEKMLKERGLVLRVQAAQGLQFSPTELSVEPGVKVRLIFRNPDIMQHNLLLLSPGSVEEIGALSDQMATQPDGITKHYIPDSDKVLVASKLVAPQAEEELVFTAPEVPGDYPYLCTFPGHWRIMKGVLHVSEKQAIKAPVKSAPTPSTISKSRNMIIETSASPNGFKTLALPRSGSGTIKANRKTNNDPISSLTDGKLKSGFGPVFANGIKDGAYMMDLGKSQTISSVTSWSYQQAGKRGAQEVVIYGSNHPGHPGWELGDTSRFTPLGRISTEGRKIEKYTALSLRSPKDKTLGSYRWIVWQASPVTAKNENTAFQELSVEVEGNVEAAAAPVTPSKRKGGKPNIILVMTDDQGYGDLSCHGNPILKTPHLDTLHAESVRFTDFHVSPFCTPTRAALMTGNHPGYTGAYRTSSGRTMMHTDEKTVAHLFGENGYATGMVGKWHLGDNAPHRPQDRGFHDAVWHRCGGIGQASDYWGNDYFDDVYERNGEFEQFHGYCTDVWFQEGMRFVEENRDEPFFLYLALNAPHGPYRVPPEWATPYQNNKDVPNANFYGMVANIDHNMGLLRKRLDELELTDNTILIFMTDNGTAGGGKFEGLDSEALAGYNAGMRGKKSSVYDGGHRVPFFIHWPGGGLTGGEDIDTLAAHIDVLPTLADLCDIPVSDSYRPDGISLKPLLNGEEQDWKRDHHVVQYHGGAHASAMPAGPVKYSSVMTERWRLVNSDGEGLFDIEVDPAQRKNVAEEHPEVVEKLYALYEPFWDKVAPRLTPVRIDLGNPAENPAVLCSQDWYMPTGNPPWNFGSISKLPKVTGPWMVDVKKAGRYRITLRQLPKEADKPVVAKRAVIEISGKTAESPVEKGSKGVVFELDLPAGETELVTWLYDENGKAGGAYFTEVEAL